MNKFECDGSYQEDLKQYIAQILEKNGMFAQAAEREIICLADAGNLAALKFYGDMVFYKRILRKYPYREAFSLYLRSADFRLKDGKWEHGKKAYPAAYWNVGYYLSNYHRDTYLKKCETIDEIEEMSLSERLGAALELAAACIEYVKVPGAVNLIGRILSEASVNEELFYALSPVIQETLVGHACWDGAIRVSSCSSQKECAEVSEGFFRLAAEEGYVFACNNLAAREAEYILRLAEERSESADKEIADAIGVYVRYLKIAADKYEPYAANRLGLFYATGEVRAKSGSQCFREYVDQALAKIYFKKATVYPDSNSAWALFNLGKFFPADYQNDLDLLNEHMDLIRELNPEVYDIAMEL